MADAVKLPIIKLDPDTEEDLGATWIPATKPAEGGNGRVTVRLPYPRGGRGIDINPNGLVEVEIDDDTIQVDDNGRLYSPTGKSLPSVLRSKVGSVDGIPSSDRPSADNLVPVERDSGNGNVSCADGVVTVDGRITWMTVSLIVTVECPSYLNNIYTIPLVIDVNDNSKLYEIDTTQETTVINYTVALYNSTGNPLKIKSHIYKDTSGGDLDTDKVVMNVNYMMSFYGV